ncbi:MAG: class I SAM-dependent methyltransferase [Saprospiraceae bacterium]|nr:class I SAM-dependent methyltransferase [Saprospiraceae bacterium]
MLLCPTTSRNSIFYGRQFEDLLKIIADQQCKSKSLVDLGCGFGMKTHIMKQYFGRTVGIDFVENIIAVNNLLSDDPKLTFKVSDLNNSKESEEKFDYIIANGLSLFNEKNTDLCSNRLEQLVDQYGTETSTFIIWSFTNHSSTAPSGWYNHSKEELNTWLGQIEQKHNVKTQVFYPYKKLRLKNKSVKEMLLSLYRYFRKRQYYFIIIQYGIQQSKG